MTKLFLIFASCSAFAKPCAPVLQANGPQIRLLERAVERQLEAMLENVDPARRKRVAEFVARATALPQTAPAIFQHGKLRLNSILRDHPLSWIAIPHEVRHLLDSGTRHWFADTVWSYVKFNDLEEREARAARVDYQLARRLVTTVGFDAERALSEILRLEPAIRTFNLHDDAQLKNADEYFDFESLSTARRRQFEVDCFNRADMTFRRLIHFAKTSSEDEYVQMRLKRYAPDIRAHRFTVMSLFATTGALLGTGVLHLAHLF